VHVLASERTARGVAAGAGAGLLWGLAFLVPTLLEQVSAVDLTLGRYLVYGLLSAALLRSRLDRDAWRAALFMAVTGHVGYYVLLVVAIGGAGAPLAAIVVGLGLLAGRVVEGGPPPAPLLGLLAGALVLGVVVSWLAGVLWNRASADLPIERAGQLIVVETLAGAAYGYAAGAAAPDLPTLLGLALITAGVLRGQR
jgi:drug/metabolite transporter (DMT)-like permease